jgi:ribulose-5-phosphate 4-epimerase/fuculose-1-phosphate aldolase
MAERNLQLKKDVIAACRILTGKKLVEGFGHVSARIPGSDLFILTPRISLELVTEKDLLLCDLKEETVEGASPPPFEAPLHFAILRRRPDVTAVARIHARKANYFGATRVKLDPAHNHGSHFAGGVPVFPKTDLISTRRLGDAVASKLGKKPAILLRGNGQVTVGSSIPEAVMMAIYLEETADIYFGALQIGKALRLPRAQSKLRSRETLPPVDLTRAWNFFKSRLRRKP